MIPVTLATNLYSISPTVDDPQIAWIGTERIIYHGVNVGANQLTGVIRGTQGTHAQTHQVDAKIFDGGEDQVIPTPNIYWVDTAPADIGYDSGSAGIWRYNGNGNVHFSDSTDLAIATSIVLNAAGTGYAVGETLTVTGGTFTTAATLSVTAETGGIIDSVTVLDPGVYTVFPGVGAATTGSTNNDATVDYSGPVIAAGDTLRITTGTTINKSYFIKEHIYTGEINSININVPGTGWSVGDSINLLSTGVVGATAEVGGIDENGGIDYIYITNRGTAGASGAVNISLAGGADIDVSYDKEGLVLALAGDIINDNGVVVEVNSMSWAADRLLSGGLNDSTTAAAAFIQLEEGNALPISLSP